MKINYSPFKNAFYEEEHKERYLLSGTWPDDLIEVSRDDFIEYGGNPPEGKTRAPGPDNKPAWLTIPLDFVEQATAENKRRTDEANNYINEQQWPSKLMLGRLSDDEKLLFNKWLDYLDALKEIDASGAPDILWPTPPAEPAS